jgi:hypothetical protein
MSNDGNVNPMYVDTAAAVTTKPDVKIQAILWVDNDTADDDIAEDDDFELTDTNGNILISKRASFAGDDLFVSFPFGLKANGITCSAIDGGVAFIYVV